MKEEICTKSKKATDVIPIEEHEKSLNKAEMNAKRLFFLEKITVSSDTPTVSAT